MNWWSSCRAHPGRLLSRADIVIVRSRQVPEDARLRGFAAFSSWAEIVLILVPVLFLRKKKYRESHYQLFSSCVFIVLGGMALPLRSDDLRLPALEFDLLHAVGHRDSDFPRIHFDFASSCSVLAVKRLPILPAPVEQWYDLETYYKKIYPYIQMSGYGDKNQYRPSYTD